MRMIDIDNSITVEGNDKPIKARDPNAQTMQDIRRSGAAGAHKDKTKVIPRKEKYKKSPVDEAQNLDNNVEYKGWLRIYLRSPDAAETHPKHQEFLAYYMSKNQQQTINNSLEEDAGEDHIVKNWNNLTQGLNPMVKKDMLLKLSQVYPGLLNRIKESSISEADPAELGPMNDKMKDVLGKVHAGDEAEKQAEIDRAEKIRQQQVKDLGPEAMEKYVDMLKSHDWTYQYSDDHSVWQRGQAESDAISGMMKILDPDMKIYKKYSPFHDKEKTENTIFNALNQLDEVATAGATSAGSIATVANPHVAIGNKKARRDYGIRGKQPNPPKAKPIKPTDNALDMKGTSIFGGTLKRST